MSAQGAGPVPGQPANPKVPKALPLLKDLSIDNITKNVRRINAQGDNARATYVLDRLVTHLHDFARETRLSSDEWMLALLFLTEVGQRCTDVRQEYILLSDVLGLSILVDNISHPKPDKSTLGTVLGPFHTHDAYTMEPGAVLSHDADGEPLLVLCSVHDTQGRPIERCKIDVWETDSHGFYDVQRPDRTEPDGRGVLWSDAAGAFWFRGIVPVPYPIPHDGPVGRLLRLLGRHPYRPGHMHFKFEADGFDPLITALYLRDDPYEGSDAVFGVKEGLVVELGTVDAARAAKYGVKEGTRLLEWNFVLTTLDEVHALRDKLAAEAVEKLGLGKMNIIDGLPVPDVD